MQGSASNDETVQEEPPDEEKLRTLIQMRMMNQFSYVFPPENELPSDSDLEILTKSAQRTPLSDWDTKVQYITSLSGYMEGLQSEAAKTILDILKSSSHTPT
ncbi:Hypothetical predicted protein [Mytilus galloprovincialis]|uniref:Uncharacterized protein n=1 Tax=Mytilus galloprovincialis TaxID=29158 RepID=A0A8B6DWN1_MYTGA|nr:Hypothetical predicted protein [Mytilus galloprovincialis]